MRIRDRKKFESGIRDGKNLDPGVLEYYVWRNGNHRNFFLQTPSFAVKISMCSPVGFFLSLPSRTILFTNFFDGPEIL
jgi:hypothetical protein